jgi:hypothetical protein
MVPAASGQTVAMTRLGDVLELIFAPADAQPSLHAVVREWRDPELAAQAGEEAADEIKSKLPMVVRVSTFPLYMIGRVKYRGRPDEPDEPTGESRLEVWRDGSGRYRLERSWNAAEGARRLVTLAPPTSDDPFKFPKQRTFDAIEDRQLRRGGCWPSPSQTDGENMFDVKHLREVVSEIQIVAAGESVVAGRAVLNATARQRSTYGLWPHWLPCGADEFHLSFDLEYGHLLRIEGIWGGRSLETLEVTSIEYGATIPELMFTVA